MENPNLLETTNENGEVIAKNPVWMFPTDSTNFLRIQNDVNFMLTGVEKISTVPKDSSAYHTGMIDVSDRALQLRINIMDATPYMYVSAPNVLYSVIWDCCNHGNLYCIKKKERTTQEADELGV